MCSPPPIILIWSSIPRILRSSDSHISCIFATFSETFFRSVMIIRHCVVNQIMPIIFVKHRCLAGNLNCDCVASLWQHVQIRNKTQHVQHVQIGSNTFVLKTGYNAFLSCFSQLEHKLSIMSVQIAVHMLWGQLLKTHASITFKLKRFCGTMAQLVWMDLMAHL